MILLFVVSSVFVYTVFSQECNTPILRDIISGDSSKTTDFVNGLGTSVGGLVPLLNQSQALELRHFGNYFPFSTPIFTLDTSYWITAIDIQFGNTRACTGSGEVRSMETIRVGNTDPGNTTTPAIQVGYAVSDILNMTELGDPNNGRIIRLKVNPISGRYIKYSILTTEPPGSNTEIIFLCLRTELYGCATASNSAPSSSTFLQYNLIEPTAGGYRDSGYTGVVSEGYLSGGEGLLTDGSIGTDPQTDTSQWVGWSNPDLSDPEILLLFSRTVSVRNISVFYWGDTAGAGAVSVEISSQAGVETALSEETQSDGGVYWRIFSYAGFSTGLLKLNLVGTETALLTEIQVLDSGGSNLLGPLLDTSRFTTATTGTTVSTETTGTTAGGMSSTVVSSSAVIYQYTSMTSLNTTVAATNAPMNIAVIAAVLAIVVIGLLLLVAVLLAVFLLLWRRRRGKEGAKQTLENQLGLYKPIKRKNDPYYELPAEVAPEDREYATIEDTATVQSIPHQSSVYYAVT